MLAYLDPGSGDSGVQIGTIIGIVIAAVVFLAVIGGVVYFAVRRAQNDNRPQHKAGGDQSD